MTSGRSPKLNTGLSLGLVTERESRRGAEGVRRVKEAPQSELIAKAFYVISAKRPAYLLTHFPDADSGLSRQRASHLIWIAGLQTCVSDASAFCSFQRAREKSWPENEHELPGLEAEHDATF